MTNIPIAGKDLLNESFTLKCIIIEPTIIKDKKTNPIETSWSYLEPKKRLYKINKESNTL